MGGWNALWAEEEAAERVTGVAGVVAEDFFKGDAAAASSCFFVFKGDAAAASSCSAYTKGAYTKH